MSLLYYPILVLVLDIGQSFQGHWQDEKVYSVSELTHSPQPLIGLENFKKKWSGRVRYPEEAEKKNIQGMVLIEFVVNRDGSIQDAAVRSGVGHGCNEAALAGFIELSKQPWKPGIRSNQPVRVKMVLPFYFKIIKT